MLATYVKSIPFLGLLHRPTKSIFFSPTTLKGKVMSYRLLFCFVRKKQQQFLSVLMFRYSYSETQLDIDI